MMVDGPQSIDLKDMISSNSSSLSASREMSSFWTEYRSRIEGRRGHQRPRGRSAQRQHALRTVKVKELGIERRSDRLVVRIVVGLEVGMLKRLLDRQPRLRVDYVG